MCLLSGLGLCLCLELYPGGVVAAGVPFGLLCPECQLASNGIYVGDPKGYRHPRAAELAPGAADWLLLRQLDTDDEIGWMWGDTGTIYYWIRRQDLLAARFDQAWVIFECC